MNPTLPSPILGVSLTSPSGAAWEFLVLFLVVIIGPPLLERARLPGIIGLLLGGFVIGPNGLNVIGAGNTTVPELGQIGLLYLMFVAGLELDLALLRVHRLWVILFGAISFLIPAGLGSIVGFSLNWNAPAALLLGGLVASHTLLTYPTVRNAGLSTHPAVATAVGATVLTDTASLVVLAAVSGSQLEGGGPASIGLQVVFGLLVVVVFSLVVLPRMVRLGFRYLGTDRIVRYLLAVASFLAAATVAGVVGIEGIVGAFFAGLGLNRLIPNEGPLMERIDFFGSAVFVPVFLVSVGMLLKPSVMIQPETLKLAALFTLASLGGKTLACLIAKRPMRLSLSESALMLGVTVPQAAATLAATVIGFNIGLFDQSVVNAVLVLILVTIIVATLLVDRAKRAVTVPRADREPIGKRVLVALEDPAQAPMGFLLGARIAAPDSGVVRGLLGSSPHDTTEQEAGLSQLRTAGYAVGVDVDPALLVHTALAEGIVNVVAAQHPSFVLVGQRSASAHLVLGGPGEAVAASVVTPVAILVGDATRISEVVLVEADPKPDVRANGARALASELASRIGGKRVALRRAASAHDFSEAAPGQLWIAPHDAWQALSAADPPDGAAVMMVFNPGAPPGIAQH
jgi:Kef-type K+ transport system membrane component KefB